MNPTHMDRNTARFIAAGMLEVSECDGVTPDESALISAFVEGLPNGAASAVNPTAFDTPSLKEALVKSLALVAIADGEVTSGELEIIQRHGLSVGLTADQVESYITAVAESMFSELAKDIGITVLGHQMFDIGRKMGLSDESIERIIGE
tara:strand:+ start:144 stop:590 length:447 start_codon:yes stop_codon:yes gene_type:complete